MSVLSRDRRSSSRLAIVGFGTLAAVLAASVGASTAGAAGGAAGASADGDARAIRAVDFGEVPQPGSSCREGLRFSPPERVAVSEGASPVLDLGRLAQLAVDPAVGYGDLTGDGIEDAAVHVTCTFGASGEQHSVHAWSLEGDDLTLLGSIDEAPAGLVGDFAAVVDDVRVRDGSLMVTWLHHGPDDPNCCPTQETDVDYRLTASGRLHPQS